MKYSCLIKIAIYNIQYVTNYIILNICAYIRKTFSFSFLLEFYEEALSLVYDLTGKKISADMWKVLELIYQLFQKDGYDYFTDMMPALHNYITVDTQAFLSNENHILAMFNMCKAVSIYRKFFSILYYYFPNVTMNRVTGIDRRCRRRSRVSCCQVVRSYNIAMQRTYRSGNIARI